MGQQNVSVSKFGDITAEQYDVIFELGGLLMKICSLPRNEQHTFTVVFNAIKLQLDDMGAIITTDHVYRNASNVASSSDEPLSAWWIS